MSPNPNIGIIFGGRSVEHEVSVLTGYQALEAIDRDKYEITPVYLARDNVWYVGPELDDLEFFRQEHPPLDRLTRVLPSPDASRGKLRLRSPAASAFRKPKEISLDCVIPATHGTFGEDGCLQGLLEMAGVPYAGSSVRASAIGMDKLLTKAVLREAGLPCVEYTAADRQELAEGTQELLDRIEAALGFPAFVKPAVLGSSVGVARVDNRENLLKALQFASRFCDRIIIEKALSNATEINCSVLDGDPPVASVLEQPVSSSELLSFDEKYRGGGKGTRKVGAVKGMAGQQRIIPAPLSDEVTGEIRTLAMKTFIATGAGGVVRVDFLMSDAGKVYVNEINNIPGSFSFYLWEHMGRSFRELLDRLIGRAFEIRRLSNKTTYSFDSNLLGTKK